MLENPVTALEHAAATAGLDFNWVLKQAGVAATTHARWKAGSFDPRLSTLRKIQSVIEGAAAQRP